MTVCVHSTQARVASRRRKATTMLGLSLPKMGATELYKEDGPAEVTAERVAPKAIGSVDSELGVGISIGAEGAAEGELSIDGDGPAEGDELSFEPAVETNLLRLRRNVLRPLLFTIPRDAGGFSLYFGACAQQCASTCPGRLWS